MSRLIRYRFALLLLIAAMSLVTNPVWHATAHLISDHSCKHTKQVFDVKWAEADLCPYCDAVSPVAEAVATKPFKRPLVRVGEITPLEGDLVDLRLLISTRLRAPPVLS